MQCLERESDKPPVRRDSRIMLLSTTSVCPDLLAAELADARVDRDRALAAYLQAGKRGDQLAASRALRALAELTARVDELSAGAAT